MPKYWPWTHLFRNEACEDEGQPVNPFKNTRKVWRDEKLPWEAADGGLVDLALALQMADADSIEAVQTCATSLAPNLECKPERLARHMLDIWHESKSQEPMRMRYMQSKEGLMQALFCRRCRIFGCRLHSAGPSPLPKTPPPQPIPPNPRVPCGAHCHYGPGVTVIPQQQNTTAAGGTVLETETKMRTGVEADGVPVIPVQQGARAGAGGSSGLIMSPEDMDGLKLGVRIFGKNPCAVSRFTGRRMRCCDVAAAFAHLNAAPNRFAVHRVPRKPNSLPSSLPDALSHKSLTKVVTAQQHVPIPESGKQHTSAPLNRSPDHSRTHVAPLTSSPGPKIQGRTQEVAHTINPSGEHHAPSTSITAADLRRGNSSLEHDSQYSGRESETMRRHVESPLEKVNSPTFGSRCDTETRRATGLSPCVGLLQTLLKSTEELGGAITGMVGDRKLDKETDSSWCIVSQSELDNLKRNRNPHRSPAQPISGDRKRQREGSGSPNHSFHLDRKRSEEEGGDVGEKEKVQEGLLLLVEQQKVEVNTFHSDPLLCQEDMLDGDDHAGKKVRLGGGTVTQTEWQKESAIAVEPGCVKGSVPLADPLGKVLPTNLGHVGTASPASKLNADGDSAHAENTSLPGVLSSDPSGKAGMQASVRVSPEVDASEDAGQDDCIDKQLEDVDLLWKPDADPTAPRAPRPPRQLTEWSTINLRKTPRKNWPQTEPCGCLGKCTTECPCHLLCHNFCDKFCACAKTCKNRWRGCQCRKGCLKQCPCREARRECDPDVCRNCDLDSCGGRAKCVNMAIRRGKHARTVVAPSGFEGWGVFAATKVPKGDFVGEYTGELVTQAETDRRGILYDFYNRSYLFNLNEMYSLDATHRGNKMRLANHSYDPNVEQTILAVEGSDRIGYFATKQLLPGDELVIDYRYQESSNMPKWAKECAAQKRKQQLSNEMPSSSEVEEDRDEEQNKEDAASVVFPPIHCEVEQEPQSTWLEELKSALSNS